MTLTKRDSKDAQGRHIKREYVDEKGRVVSSHDCGRVGCYIALDGTRIRAGGP